MSKLKRLKISLDVTVAGLRLCFDLYPFRYAVPAWRYEKPFIKDRKALHVWFGPLHHWWFWSDTIFGLSFDVDFRGGFHGETPMGKSPFRKFLDSWKDQPND